MPDIEPTQEANVAQDLEPAADGAAVTPASRGLVDGSLNNSNTLNGANILGAMIGSKLEANANNNANTRAEGK